MSPHLDPQTALAQKTFRSYYYELKNLGGKRSGNIYIQSIKSIGWPTFIFYTENSCLMQGSFSHSDSVWAALWDT